MVQLNKVLLTEMTKIIVTIVFFLSIGIHIAWAWDFCVPNEDDIMLYYNVVDEDEGSCEVAQNKDVIWNCRVLRIPERVILNRGNRDFGDPDTVYTVVGIGRSAFYSRYKPIIPDKDYDPTSLFEHVVLPKMLSYIADSAFYGCLWISSLEFPEGNKWLQSIGEYAFAWAGPTKLTIPKTLRTISPHAFEYSGLGYVEFEEGNEHLTAIPEYCFRGSSLVRVKFSPEMEVIGDYAFAECVDLEPPVFPYGLGVIGNGAFKQHKYWSSLEIPETIMDIGEHAFSSKSNPKDKDCPAVLHIDTLYVNKETTPYCVSEKSLGDYQYSYKERKHVRPITGTYLVVPQGCVEEYATTYPWDRFETRYILARDLSGIKPAKVKTSQPEGVFSLDGRRLTKTQKGLNIIRYKDGTAKKIVVK